MTDAVELTLKEWRSTLFEWGVSDCLMSVANYMRAWAGVDPGADFRGVYNDEAGAQAILDGYGGAVALLDRSCLPHAPLRADGQPEPVRGDAVIFDAGGTPIGGICTGKGIACRRERGVAEVERRLITVIQAWKVV